MQTGCQQAGKKLFRKDPESPDGCQGEQASSNTVKKANSLLVCIRSVARSEEAVLPHSPGKATPEVLCPIAVSAL